MQHYPQLPPASYAVYPPPPQQPYSAAAPYYAQGYQAVQGTGNPNRVYDSNYVFLSVDSLIGSVEILLFCGWWLISTIFPSRWRNYMEEALLALLYAEQRV
jgi:hypothetical protein